MANHIGSPKLRNRLKDEESFYLLDPITKPLSGTEQATMLKKLSYKQKVGEYEISKLRLENQILKQQINCVRPHSLQTTIKAPNFKTDISQEQDSILSPRTQEGKLKINFCIKEI